MIARSQRIMAGIELFSLTLWVGGLFFLVALLKPGIDHMYPDDPDAAWRMLFSFYNRFGLLEIVLAVAVLASNFLKTAALGGKPDLQRFALLVAAILLTITLFSGFIIRPRLEAKRTEIAALAVAQQNSDKPTESFITLRGQYEKLLVVNLAFGFFLVYCYHHYEERKLQAFARILKGM